MSVPIEIGHGDHDPQVSVEHALRAFDLLAPGAVSAIEGAQIKSQKPASATTGRDPLLNAAILLRRSVGAFRLTIYDGEHDYKARAWMAWLEQHIRA